MKHTLLLSVFFLAMLNGYSQNVQYAKKIVDFSSDLGGKMYAVEQVLGKPNAMPQGGKSACAWLPRNAESVMEFVQVSFEKPMKTAQVIVFENFNPGTVKEVFLVNGAGKMQSIYKGKPGPITESMKTWSFRFPLTDYEVYGVKVVLNCAAVVGPNQIDAIAISDSESPVEAQINVIPDLKFESKPENLGEKINSTYGEVLPVITPDGKRLYFTRKDYPGDEKDKIWYSDLGIDNKWTNAIRVREPLNNKNNNFVNTVTPDGNSILLGNQYNEDGSPGNGVSMTHREKEGWIFPKNQVISNLRNYDDYVNYSLSNNGKELYMAIEYDDTKGQADIYVSFLKDDKTWTTPKNLGKSVNTAGDEGTPFVASDGVTLYYQSDGISTYGGQDMFMVKRLDDTWTNWSEPVNLGPDINTSNWDAYYTVPASGEYAYFVRSGGDSYGESDIYRIKLPGRIKPDPVVLVYGKVFNAKTKEPLEAEIKYESLISGKEAGIARTNPATGEYKIVLTAGKNYGFYAVAPNFIAVNENLDLAVINEYKELNKDLYLVPIEIGQTVRLNNIFFETAKADLKPESFIELDRLVKILSENPTIEIEIAGHTDNVGDDNYNLDLSQKRAQSVTDYIVSKGISVSRFMAKGYGESKPIGSNDTEEGKSLNRRVEFTILKK